MQFCDPSSTNNIAYTCHLLRLRVLLCLLHIAACCLFSCCWHVCRSASCSVAYCVAGHRYQQLKTAILPSLRAWEKKHNVEQSGVWEPNMTVGKNELHTCIVMVQECMARRSSCARAMWIHRLRFRSLVLKPLVWGSQLCWVHWPPVVFGVAEISMGCLSCPWLNWLHCLLVCASEQMLASSDLLYVLFWVCVVGFVRFDASRTARTS